MHVAFQMNDITADNLQFAKQVGVDRIVGVKTSDVIPEGEPRWTKESLIRFKDFVESHEMRLEVLPLPLRRWNPETPGDSPNIMLGTPERDREIDNICECVRIAGEVGIPCLKYNLTLLGVLTTGRSIGRGGVSCRTFDFEKVRDAPMTSAGHVTADMMWERITYFLERVIPVAEESGVRMACHQHDAPVPQDTGVMGVNRALGSVDGLKTFIDIVDSPFHGLNFCQGTVSEMLDRPGEEIFDVIRYFGERKRIFMVHFRNIRGGFLKFEECYIDEGDVDMWEAMKVYKEVGYDGIFCPDHVPKSDQDTPWGHRQRAYTAGYIKALIKAVQG
jgi:mannonate dehydratase